MLPHANAKEGVQTIAKGFLNASENKDVVIPEGAEIRIIQNTEDTRYLILPASPKTLTEAELKMVAGGDDSIETYTEAAVAVYEVEAAATGTTAAVEVEVVVAGVAVLI